MAKLFEFRRIEVGPYVANLIDKGAARSILRNGFEGEQERSIPGLRPVMELMVDNWAFVGWALTFTELVVGGLLIVGAATRAAALVALGQALFLALVFATRNRWAFEQPHEYVPLIIWRSSRPDASGASTAASCADAAPRSESCEDGRSDPS